MINLLTLHKKIQVYRVTRDEDMPLVYQFANPSGRPYHEDWLFGKCVKRMDTAYKPPFPFEMIAGNATKVRRPLPLDYPLVPGVAFEIGPWWDGEKNVDKKWVWMVDPIQPAGHWAKLAVYLPDGSLEPCFYTRSMGILGNKVPLYYGLKHDPHPVDCMAWMWEASVSIKWKTLA